MVKGREGKKGRMDARDLVEKLSFAMKTKTVTLFQ